MTMAEYIKQGGSAMWILYASWVLGIPGGNIKITSEKEGSVILDFVIADPDAGSYEDQQKSLKKIKATLDKAVKTGDMKYEGAVILNYGSGIVTASIFLFLIFNLISKKAAVESCPEGQYPEPIANVCLECPDGCPNCATEKCENESGSSDDDDGSSHLGAILGGVLGGLALILVIVIIVVKRDTILGWTKK